MEKRGTVTPIASLFPAQEVEKASLRVQDAIVEREQQLKQLNGFITDNNNLINLVRKLPDQLHHDLMVPFGKAAFFPGRLIHTNECMVLLGEGYYAQRTSKQTTEILKRRSKALNSQVESLKAVMDDLKVQASFFDNTASEASENLVEIREDFVEENFELPTQTGSESSSSIGIKADNKRPTADDEEYAHLFARMDELEKQELEAGNSSESDESEDEQEAEESSEANEGEQIQNELISNIGQMSVSQEVNHSQVEASEAQRIVKDVSPLEDTPITKGSTGNNLLELPKAQVEDQSPLLDSNPAFTNTIIERNPDVGTNSKPVSSKPMSRFRMMQMKQ